MENEMIEKGDRPEWHLEKDPEGVNQENARFGLPASPFQGFGLNVSWTQGLRPGLSCTAPLGLLKAAVPFFLVCLILVGCQSRADLPGRQQIDLLVSGGTVVTMAPDRKVLENGGVAIQNGRVLAVGPSAELATRYRGSREIDATGKIVMPGLINTHGHAPMVLFRGLADDRPLMEWLQKYIFPAEAKNVTPEFVQAGTELACLEMIRSGTTTYVDMYYFEDKIAEVTDRIGMRGVLGETIIEFPAPDNKTAEAALTYTEKFAQRWKGSARIVPSVAPHAPYTNSAEILKASKKLADRYRIPLQIHVSETQDEVKQIREKYGKTSTQWLDKLGVLGSNVFFHHGVWLTEEDLQIVRQRGVGVTHNPESNMKHSSGAAPVLRMLELGISVGLGTDGAASNNNLDMFEAMDFAAKLHKLVTMSAKALPAETVVEMGTVGGARVLGMEKEIGSLEVGKRADVIVVDLESPHGQPLYNVYSQLVYSLKGSDVRTSIIDGKLVMLDRRILTADESLILRNAKVWRDRILTSLNKQEDRRQ